MENFIRKLRATALDGNYDSAYDEISKNYVNYSKMEIVNIAKELLYAISKSDDRKEILLDTAEGLGDIYDIYDV